jgi:hypothetical protein
MHQYITALALLALLTLTGCNALPPVVSSNNAAPFTPPAVARWPAAATAATGRAQNRIALPNLSGGATASQTPASPQPTVLSPLRQTAAARMSVTPTPSTTPAPHSLANAEALSATPRPTETNTPTPSVTPTPSRTPAPTATRAATPTVPATATSAPAPGVPASTAPAMAPLTATTAPIMPAATASATAAIPAPAASPLPAVGVFELIARGPLSCGNDNDCLFSLVRWVGSTGALTAGDPITVIAAGASSPDAVCTADTTDLVTLQSTRQQVRLRARGQMCTWTNSPALCVCGADDFAHQDGGN